MRISHRLSAAIMLAAAGLSIDAARAETSQQPNLSCISERPTPHQRVLRDCGKIHVPAPVAIPEPYLTPSEAPLFPQHDTGNRGRNGAAGSVTDRGGRSAGAE